MDNWLIARFQSIVNLFQHKKIWWIEQCGYVIAIAIIGRCLTRSWSHWLDFLWLTIDAWCLYLIVLCGKSEVRTEFTFGYHQKFLRALALWCTIWMVGMDAFLLSMGKQVGMGSLWSDLWMTALTCCHYFGCCENPPPPKPKTKLAFDGSGA